MEILANMQLITNEVRIKNNNLPNGQFILSPQFTRKIGKIDENKYFTELTIEITDKDEAKFPIDLLVRFTGIFELNNYTQDQIDGFLKKQAVQILFPYMRTMVTNITSSTMMVPIILPIININTLFPDDTI